MPRYFFDLIDDKTVHDMKGVTLANEDEAQQYAQTFARELIEAKSTLLGEPFSRWSVRISNAKFQPIMTIPFTTIFPNAAEK